jgi:flavorubredoxin
MQALVVYESLWGNTKAVAEAIAEGIGDGARAVSTAEADAEKLRDLDLLVAGAPILGFSLPTDSIRRSIESNPAHSDHPPDMSHPSTRSWLASLPPAKGLGAGFETKIWWSPGSSAKRISKELAAAGYELVSKPARFIVEGTYGPLREGELDRARSWGRELGEAARERTKR